MDHDHSGMAPAAGESNMTGMSTSMSMQMSFYWGKRATILFEGWRTTSVGNYIGSLLALLVIAFVYQYLELLTSSASPLLCFPSTGGGAGGTLMKSSDGGLKQSESGYGKNMSVGSKLLLTALFGARVGLAYLLMLAVMSFNGGVFLAVVLGLSAGFFVFRTDIHAPARSAAPASQQLHAAEQHP